VFIRYVESRSYCFASWNSTVRTLFLICIVLSGGVTEAQNLNIIRIGTGSTAGTYFPVGGLIANAISNPPGSRPCDRGGSCGLPGLIAVAQSTAGSVENIRAVVSGDMEMGFSQADVAYWAYHGTGFFEGEAPMESLRVVAMLFPENVHLLARRSARIGSITQLSGKTVALGGKGSGTLLDSQLILSAFGIRFENLDIRELDVEAAVEAIVVNNIDAMFLVAGAPALAVQDVIERLDVELVPITGPSAFKLSQVFPFFVQGYIPARTYGEHADIRTLNVGAVLVVHADLDADLVYGITKALWHQNNLPLYQNGHPRGAFMLPTNATLGLSIRLHSGALRYYDESGLM